MRRQLGELRIIGGEWRSRKVLFDADPAIGLRATPDRVRQTVFDWLAPVIREARCLDLFAGSGAMGLEALSRGAAHCTFVDSGAPQCRDIRTAIASFKAEARTVVVQADARRWLTTARGPFEVVFFDPPFASSLLAEVLPALLPHLAHPHRLVIEWSSERPALPQGFVWLREKQAGQVSYGLACHGPSP
jgi:16S rRNA (guanine966-N2)-methyltransferase